MKHRLCLNYTILLNQIWFLHVFLQEVFMPFQKKKENHRILAFSYMENLVSTHLLPVLFRGNVGKCIKKGLCSLFLQNYRSTSFLFQHFPFGFISYCLFISTTEVPYISVA